MFFPHGIGHLLGLDVHDMEDLGDTAAYAPDYSRSNQFGLAYLRLDRVLEPGMVVTIEPGFYQIPGIEERTCFNDLRHQVNWDRLKQFNDVPGIRIEDDVVVTETGCRVLTETIPKTPDELAAVVGTA